jgi:hypothetical protein
LAFAAIPTAPSTLKGQRSNAPHSISKGRNAAKILEMTEKEGEVMIITQVAGKTSGMTDKGMNLPKLPDWPSKKTNDKPPSPCWWHEILDLKKRDLLIYLTSQVCLFCLFYAKMAWGKVMELFLSADHLIATIGVHMSKVTNFAIW